MFELEICNNRIFGGREKKKKKKKKKKRIHIVMNEKYKYLLHLYPFHWKNDYSVCFVVARDIS